MDLSPAFQKGVTKHLPKARITVDRFHLIKLVNEAVDQVRRLEALSQPDLKKTRWIWLKNPDHLKARQREQLDGLKDRNLKTALAYRMRLTFQEIFTVQNRHQGASLLRAWMDLARESGLPPMVKVAYTIMNHWDGILRFSTATSPMASLKASTVSCSRPNPRHGNTGPRKTSSTWPTS